MIKLAKKGNTKHCKNWRGIPLLSVVGKILCRIIIHRIRSGVDHRLRKEQAGLEKVGRRQNRYLYYGTSLSR